MVRFITVEKMSEATGYTRVAIYKKCNDGVWPQKQIWHKAPDGRILIDTEEYEKWVISSGVLHPVGVLRGRPRSPCKLTPLKDISRQSPRLQSFVLDSEKYPNGTSPLAP